MKLLILFISLFSFSQLFADEVKIEVNPPRPVAGEVFQVYFRIFTTLSDEPEINFSPTGLEVVDKANHGISTRTIYANGKLTVTREITVVYEMVSNRVGTASLRDINVQLGRSNLKHPSLNITVLKEAEQIPEVFVMADVPKKTLFLGEGIVVRYFIYSKVSTSNIDIKKHPKLDNFLKRFLQETDRSERVSVEGEPYMRALLYSAKIFPEKIGELKIDPLQISTSYATFSNNDPFARFGIGRNMKTKTLSSETVKVTVVPLPQPVPSHFTGLIGKHDIDIQFGKTKLIVNEPLEFTLTVSGEGALENLEAPEIIKLSGLEEFESNGDLKLTNSELATKTFNYTFLAKENLQSPSKVVTLSYLDPTTQKYMPVQLNIPEIIVAGGSALPLKEPENKSDEIPIGTNRPSAETPSLSTKIDLAGPISSLRSGFNQWLSYINLSLAILALLIAFGWTLKQKSFSKSHHVTHIPKEFKKGHFSFSEFAKWLTPLIQLTGKSPLKIIHDSSLSKEAKDYFIELLLANDKRDYSSQKTQLQFTYRSSYFKELGRYIASCLNENSSKPS